MIHFKFSVKTVQTIGLIQSVFLLLMMTNCSPKAVKTVAVEKRPPNIIVIFADDLGYGDLGCYGETKFKTPVIDSLADGGFRSTDFFIPSNVCSPSRASLLTGRYPMRNGYPVASDPEFPKYKNYGLAPDELTIPELLKSAGYQTLMVGKWHLGMPVKGSHPLDAGFDEYFGIPRNYDLRGYGDNNTLYHNREIVEEQVAAEVLTTRYTDKVVSFIKKQKNEPFFIYLSHLITHSPIRPSKNFLGSSGKGAYGDFIQELDHSTGRIMQALREAQLDDNTLVVFTSDNGPTFMGSTGGLNGGKYCTMEGGHRVPGIFYWPGHIPAGQTSNTLISSMDLLPLFCGLAGVDLPKDRKIDGKNIMDILKGKSTKSPHEYTYYYNGLNLQAVRKGNWKLHLPRTIEDQPFWSKVTNPRVNKGFLTLDKNVLFNLETDIGEKIDVADQHPEIVKMLLKQADIIRAELGDVHVIGSDQRVPKLEDPQSRPKE